MKFRQNLILISAVLLSLPAFAPCYEQVLSDEEVKGTIAASKLGEIFNRYLAVLEIMDPEEATRLGVHAEDAKLTLRTPEAEKNKLATLSVYLEDVRKIDRESLKPGDALDLSLFETKLMMDIYNIPLLAPLQKRPQYYLSALDAVYGILNKDFEPYETRAKNALSRLEQLPGVLAEAERNLYHPPKIWVEQTARECADADKSFSELTPLFKKLVGTDPILRTRVDKAVASARDAVRRYKKYLEEDVLVQADGDFRIGEETYGYYMERWHKTSVTPPQAYRIAKREYAKAKKEFVKELSVFLGRRDVSAADYDEALAKLSEERPNPDDLTAVFQQELERSYRHFDRFRLLPVPSERLRTVETPAYLVSRTPFVFYSRPYPLDETRVAELYVSVPSKKLPEKTRPALMRANFSYPYIELSIAHEAFPGRHLQNALSAEISRIRRTADSPFVTNGWAAYSQYLGLERGYYTSHAAKMVYLRWQMARAARAAADAGLHIQKLSYDEALDFLINDAAFSPGRAKAELLNVSQNPTEGISYLLGMNKIIALREKYQKILDVKFDLRDFHKRLLSIGNVPLDSLDEEIRRGYDAGGFLGETH